MALNKTTMKDKIIAAIERYLVQETHLSNKHGETFVQFMHPIKVGFNRAEYCQEIAAEIAEKVLAIVEQTNIWGNAPEWADWLVSDKKGLSQWFEDKPHWDDDLGFWDVCTEEGRYKFAGKLFNGKTIQQRPK